MSSIPSFPESVGPPPQPGSVSPGSRTDSSTKKRTSEAARRQLSSPEPAQPTETKKLGRLKRSAGEDLDVSPVPKRARGVSGGTEERSLGAEESVLSDFEGYDEVMELLTRLSEKRLTKSALGKEQYTLIESFFLWALGNVRLSNYLHKKTEKTDTEEIVSSFAYITGQQNKEKVAAALKKMGTLLGEGSVLGEFLMTRNKLQGYFQKRGEDYQGSLDASLRLLKRCRGCPKKEIIEEKAKALLFPSEEVEWSVRFSDAHLKAVGDLLDTVQKALQGTGLSQAQQKALTEVKTQLKEYKEALVTARQQRNEIQKGSPSPLMTLDQLKTVERFSKISSFLELLPAKSGHDETLQFLRKASQNAQVYITALDDLMQALSSYTQGTILFDDEALKKAFEGGNHRAFSQMHCWKWDDLMALAEGLSERNAFYIQPYFTGRRTHAAIVVRACDETGSFVLCKAEVRGAYDVEIVGIANGLTDVSYEPDFEKMLSDAGKEQLVKKGLTADHVRHLYERSLSSFIDTHDEELNRIQNNSLLAAYAWIKRQSYVNRKFWEIVAKRYIPGAADRDLTGKDRPKALAEGEKDLASFQTTMFCSQFVAAITQAVLTNVNTALNEELQTENIQYFHPMSGIGEKNFETMDPSALEGIIQSHYSFGSFPAITRFLLGNDYGTAAQKER